MIPLATTTVTVRTPGTGEPYEAPSGGAIVASEVPAHLSSPSGQEKLAGGAQQVIDKRLVCETTEITHQMTITDDNTAQTYVVVWVDQRQGLGLDHTVAGLRKIGAPV